MVSHTFLVLQVALELKKIWICFHGVEPIDFVPPYFWMGIDLLIYEYHVIGKCSVSPCQKIEWTVLCCKFENFLFLSCLPPFETSL